MNHQIFCILLSNPSIDVKNPQGVIDLANQYIALIDAERKQEDERINAEYREQRLKDQNKRIDELNAEVHRLRVDLYAATNGPVVKGSKKK